MAHPPLQAGDLLTLYAVLATMAARGTAEIVLPARSSGEWIPVGFHAAESQSPQGCLKHLAGNGWLAVRPGDGRGLIVGLGQMATAGAFVVPAPGKALTPDGVIAWCREHMANYKVPRRVEVVDALPQNASGKVLKYALREHARGGAGGA